MRKTKTKKSASPAGRENLRPLLRAVVESLIEKKGEDIRVLDVGGVVSYTDFLVVVGGQSAPQVQALVDAVEKAVKGKWKPTYINRSQDHSWWIIDFVDVVVHVFKGEARALYDLEGLWVDAPDGRSAAGLDDLNFSAEND